MRHTWLEPKTFGDLFTCDHKIVAEKNPDNESLQQDKVALICYDFVVRWIDGFPAKSRSTEEVLQSLREFAGPDQHVKAIYSDNASEITNAVRMLDSLPVTCTPHVPQTNGIAEGRNSLHAYAIRFNRVAKINITFTNSFWKTNHRNIFRFYMFNNF